MLILAYITFLAGVGFIVAGKRLAGVVMATGVILFLLFGPVQASPSPWRCGISGAGQVATCAAK